MALGSRTRAIVPPNMLTGSERIRSIVRDTPGVIKFDYDKAKTAFKFKKGATFIHAVGYGTVKKYNRFIQEYASKYKVDVELIKAIIYLENSRGWYDTFDPLRKTERPGNINVTTARRMGKDPYTIVGNIEASVLFIQRLGERLDAFVQNKDLTLLTQNQIIAIGTLYNGTSQDNARLDDYGISLLKFYNDRPWLSASSPYDNLAENRITVTGLR